MRLHYFTYKVHISLFVRARSSNKRDAEPQQDVAYHMNKLFADNPGHYVLRYVAVNVVRRMLPFNSIDDAERRSFFCLLKHIDRPATVQRQEGKYHTLLHLFTANT